MKIYPVQSELPLIEIHSAVERDDCALLEKQLPSLLSPDSTTVVDFSNAQIAQDTWPRLERVLCRLVARAPRDLWLTGLQAWPDWNHAAGIQEVKILLQSPPLAWARISRWIELRLQGIQQHGLQLQSGAAPDPRPALRKISRLRHDRRGLERELEVLRARFAESTAPGAGPGPTPSLERLEQTILTALASQGVRLPEGGA